MSFKCKSCGEEVTNSEMLGLVIGQVTSATLESKGIKTQSALKSGFDRGQFTAGFLSGLSIKCANCGKSNWK